VQRAATARALLADAGLLVFDDISSALDAATEQRLWQRLLTGGARPTVLVVSHRAAALAHADQVVVLADGRVAAVGPPEEVALAGFDLVGAINPASTG
jgi:ATP-binding cassette subfamily B protein